MTGTEGGKQGHEPGSNPRQKGVSPVAFAGAGIQFAVILVVGAFAGMWLDRKLGTSPWLLIVVFFLGAATAFYSLYYKLMKGQRLGDRRQQHERREDVE